jgi:hypothetical protein
MTTRIAEVTTCDAERTAPRVDSTISAAWRALSPVHHIALAAEQAGSKA